MHCIKGAVCGFKQLLMWDHTGSMAACFPLVSAHTLTHTHTVMSLHRQTRSHAWMHTHTRACTHVHTFGSIEALSCKADRRTFDRKSAAATASETIRSLCSLPDFSSLATFGVRKWICVHSLQCFLSIEIFQGQSDKSNIQSGLMLLRWYADFMHSLHEHCWLRTPGTTTETARNVHSTNTSTLSAGTNLI